MRLFGEIPRFVCARIGLLSQIALLLALLSCSSAVAASGPLDASEDSGWATLSLCAELTSLDARTLLSLGADNSATLTAIGDQSSRPMTGTWSLIDREKRLYRLDVAGAEGVYLAVPLPDARGCMLAADHNGRADLVRSWFLLRPDTVESQASP